MKKRKEGYHIGKFGFILSIGIPGVICLEMVDTVVLLPCLSLPSYLNLIHVLGAILPVMALNTRMRGRNLT